MSDDINYNTIIRLDKDYFKKNRSSITSNENRHSMPEGKEVPEGEIFSTVGCTNCSNTLFFGLFQEDTEEILLLCQHCDCVVGHIAESSLTKD